MNFFSGFVVFQVIWWTTLFAVLPFGVKMDENPERGMATSAPVQPHLLKKMGITTAISIFLWGIVFFIIESGVISLR